MKAYFILDFDDCLFEHPHDNFHYGLSNAFVDAIEEIYAPSESRERLLTRVQNGFSEYGIKAFTRDNFVFADELYDPMRLYVRMFEIFTQNYMTENDIAHIRRVGDKYRDVLNNQNFEISILTHSTTQYVLDVLRLMGLEGSVPEYRVIGLDKTDLLLKSESVSGFYMALASFGLSVEMLKHNPFINLFFLDDHVENLFIPSKIGIQSVHVDKKAETSLVLNAYHKKVSSLKNFTDFIQNYLYVFQSRFAYEPR